MVSLLVFLGTISLTIGLYVWRRTSLKSSRAQAFVFVCLFYLSLGLALRFGGRTYPGIYFPHSPFLNSLLNGNGIFVDVGYLAVKVGWAADTLRLVVRTYVHGFKVALKGVRWLAVALAVTIALYGFYWAMILQRLP